MGPYLNERGNDFIMGVGSLLSMWTCKSSAISLSLPPLPFLCPTSLHRIIMKKIFMHLLWVLEYCAIDSRTTRNQHMHTRAYACVHTHTYMHTYIIHIYFLGFASWNWERSERNCKHQQLDMDDGEETARWRNLQDLGKPWQTSGLYLLIGF